MTAIRESICPKLVNIKSVIDITPPEPEEMTQRAEHSDAKVASTTTAREGANREVFHRCSHGGHATARFQSNAHSSEHSLVRLERKDRPGLPLRSANSFRSSNYW
jgi:hypothetical protein